MRVILKYILKNWVEIHLKIPVFWVVTMCKLFTPIYAASHLVSLESSSEQLSESQTSRGFRMANTGWGKLL